MMTYKKITLLLLLFGIMCSFGCVAKASTSKDSDDKLYLINYKNLDKNYLRAEARKNLTYYWNCKDKFLKEKYLNSAMNKYYIISQIDCSDIDAYIQLARIYDEKHIDSLAIAYFYKAQNINKETPHLNFYFGDYYFKRNDYKKALYYYKIAYNKGIQNSNINYKLGKIYEKLADLENAKKFYQLAYNGKPDKLIGEKIHSLNGLTDNKTNNFQGSRESENKYENQ